MVVLMGGSGFLVVKKSAISCSSGDGELERQRRKKLCHPERSRRTSNISSGI
jgi:hypothetical protein